MVLYFVLLLQKGTSIQEMIDSSTNQPHMIMITEEDLPTQFLIVVEQIPQIESAISSKESTFSYLYITYLIWSAILDFVICMFFEDKLLGLTTPSCKKTATYSGVTSAIGCYITK